MQKVFGKFLGAGDVTYWPLRGGGIAQHGRSLITAIDLFPNAIVFIQHFLAYWQ